MTRALLVLALSFLAACAAPGASGPAPDAREALDEPFRLLLLGDSISIGYTPLVREILGERALVMRARKPNGEQAENCAGTNHAVQHLDRWLAQDGGHWDVIHFNFGLHDLKRVHPDTGKNSSDPGDPQQADSERYETQLRAIVSSLETTGARLVFATTTPVPEGVRPYRAPSDPAEYNAVARRVMAERSIPVNDLFVAVTPQLDRLQNPADVHFNQAGSRVLAETVAASVLRVAGLE